ncbi:MAG TPA: hypothetical protein VJ725_22430 [Thermoanaerobaculia bacterium]|nr:hypothetical protein [Thermoanaerobaculia bacterium]
MISGTTARTELQALVRELEGFQGRLLALRQKLRPSPQATPEIDLLSDPDFLNQMTRVIDCVLLDSIGPAIRDLEAAAKYESGSHAEATP